MKKTIYILALLLASSTTFVSCSNESELEEINHENILDGLQKGSDEYNIALLKVFKLENDKLIFNEKLAKELGFSDYQIEELKKENISTNLFLQEESLSGSKIEDINPDNLEAEELYKDIKKKI